MTIMAEIDRFKASLTEDGRCRLLVEAITDYAIYMLDPLGFVTSWNPGARRFKGYEAGEIIGKHFSVFYPQDDRDNGLPALALLKSAAIGTFESDGWRIRKDGSRFWAHVVIDPIRDASGELMGFAKVTRDLTEQKLTENERKLSDDQFRLLVQGVTDYAIYLLDAEGRIVTWNAGAQRIKGYLPEEIIGRHFSVFYTEEDQAKCEPERALALAARDGQFEEEGWRVRRDGSRFWAKIVVNPIRDAFGKVMGFAKVTRDITEPQAAQLALERARETIFQSRKMEALGQLTGGVAHDFNNILAAVLGGLDLVMRRLPEDPNITPLLNAACQAAQRGARLTQLMLAFAHRQELRPETIDLLALVRGMTDLLQRTLGPQITLESHFSLAVAAINVDANQLELAILNLATNAHDAMPLGGLATIKVFQRDIQSGSTKGSELGMFVCLSLTDSGDGMDERTLSRAAEPFFSTKKVGNGSGLGLSMVQGFAEQSGGKLILISQKGMGTVAELWLPAAGDKIYIAPREETIILV
jgi:PAS domain S-box-containing protein